MLILSLVAVIKCEDPEAKRRATITLVVCLALSVVGGVLQVISRIGFGGGR
jgi:hypothetical protein